MSIIFRESFHCMDEGKELEQATFAAGCFWGVEAAFRQIKGVVETAVGYTGGTIPEPDYQKVCSGRTGHAEAVAILFDPAVVSYEKLLDTFWDIHDPTQVNRQGPDVGTSYRSAIFYHSPEQKKRAEASKARLAALEKYRGKTIATGIVPASQFWKAEEYHQQYFEKSGRGYCASKKCWE
jgi:peptide-methionine (S)-S-oxide reductase